MIRISFNANESTIKFEGHSLPHVCASASSIMYTTVNALMKYDEDCIHYTDNTEEDYVFWRILKHDNVIDMLIDNMLDMLNDLYEEGNADKIKIIRS